MMNATKDHEYSRAIKKIDLEHGFGLKDPEVVLSRLKNKNHEQYILCREAKELWICDRPAWNRAIKRFEQDAKELRSQWVPKPKGDPSTVPHDPNRQREQMRNLFREVIGQEQATYVPQSTEPFTASQLEEITSARLDGDSQELPPIKSQRIAVRRHTVSSSSDTFQPSSSFLGNIECLLEDNSVDQDQTEPEVVDTEMIDADPAPETSRGRDLRSGIGEYFEIRPDDGSSKKRPASIVEPDLSISKRKISANHSLAAPKIEDEANYSFNRDQGGTVTRSVSQSLSRGDSGETSFRSVTTNLHDSFATTNTSVSFCLDPSTPITDILTFWRQHHDPSATDPAANKQELFRFYLDFRNPFARTADCTPSDISFRVSYEVLKVALHNGYNPVDLFQHVKQTYGWLRGPERNSKGPKDIMDLDDLWTTLGKYVLAKQGTMPNKSSARAWKTIDLPREELKTSELNYVGVIKFGEIQRDSLINIKLDPISLDKSNRLKRKYGSDRILILGVPSVEDTDLPSYLKASAVSFRTAFIDWLTTSTHHLIGRQWRAFYVKARPRPRNGEKARFAWKVYLFAVDGHGFKDHHDAESNAPTKLSLDKMLSWCFSLKMNENQFALKLFSRVSLCLTDTIPTVVFRPDQIFEAEDIYRVKPGSCEKILMTDGCSKISLKAAIKVASILGLGAPIPSAFQGRIAGAKGLWIVDPITEVRNGSEEWIEIRPSQTKFESLYREEHHPERHRVTFEVHEYSRPLRATALNFQLLPILIDRGVSTGLFKQLLREDLDAKVADLEIAMSDPKALRAWSQEQSPVAGTRVQNEGVLWKFGMPAHDNEEINALAEVGYIPATNPYQRDLCRDAVQHYCTRVEEKMNIYPGQTTSAYMVPDFYGVLAEDEIHFGFSSNFTDKRLQWSDTMLNNCDVLVARSPAALPSDMHRVRAVFKAELAHLKDVIVFPTKGRFCLADKLSGGDYDGDRAWICWNQAIVSKFTNFATPLKKSAEHYGIEKDKIKVSDLLKDGDKASQATAFIAKGFQFNMRQSMLGICTNAHESYCYKLVNDIDQKGTHKNKFYSPMSEPNAMDIGVLLGYLVDTAKNGYTFDKEHWIKYLQKIKVQESGQPAYKTKKMPRKLVHIVDILVLEIAKDFRQDAIKKLENITKSSRTNKLDVIDADLLRMFESEERHGKKDMAVAMVIKQLKKDVNEIHALYNRLIEEAKKVNAATKRPGDNQRGEGIPWDEIHTKVRQSFLELEPLSEGGGDVDLENHPVIQRWRASMNEDDKTLLSTSGSWTLLKASAIYQKKNVGSFPWRTCGKELLALKILTTGKGVSISSDIHQFMKLDRKMLDTAKLRQQERPEFGLHTDVGDLDRDEYAEQDYETAYESQANAE